MNAKLTALVAGMVLVCSSAAQAESFFAIEIGLGASSAVKDGDSMYYDEGLGHHTPTTSFAARGGIVFNVIDAPMPSWKPGLKLHLTYTYWGSLNWNAQVAQDSVNFPDGSGGYSPVTKACLNNNCGQMRTFVSHGNTQSIALTAEAFWNVGHDWTLGAEAGPAMYFGPWHSSYIADEDGIYGPKGSVQNYSHRIVPYIGAVVGLSVAKGPFALRYQYLYAPPHWAGNESADIPSGIKGVHMITANYTF